MDAGAESGLLNADLYLTASPPGEFNGKLWYKGIDITNTKGTTGNIPAGECRHERDGNLALKRRGISAHRLPAGLRRGELRQRVYQPRVRARGFAAVP